MYMKFMLLIVSATLLNACATSNDPRKGGFFGGLSGINSGAYDERVQQRQDELNRQQNVNRDLKDTSKSLESEVQAKSTELASEQQRMTELDANLLKLDAEVGKLEAKTAKQKTEVADLKRKIGIQRKRLQSQQKAIDDLERAGGSAADPARLRVLQKERDSLNEEYKRLLDYSKALNDATK
jgi:chromosome segregation ATPase